MDPLHVRIRFSAPVVVSDHPIHLDALLAWAQADEAMENNDPDPWRTDRLPLGKDRGVWQASMVIFRPESNQELTPMTKRHNLHDLAIHRDKFYKTKKNMILGASGLYRAFDMRFSRQWMNRADAWCMGEKKEIKKLLSRLSGIGKYTKNGFGTISSISIYRDEEAVQFWKLRNLPAVEFGSKKVGYALAMRTFEPPYWDKCKIVPCLVPVNPSSLARTPGSHENPAGSR